MPQCLIISEKFVNSLKVTVDTHNTAINTIVSWFTLFYTLRQEREQEFFNTFSPQAFYAVLLALYGITGFLDLFRRTKRGRKIGLKIERVTAALETTSLVNTFFTSMIFLLSSNNTFETAVNTATLYIGLVFAGVGGMARLIFNYPPPAFRSAATFIIGCFERNEVAIVDLRARIDISSDQKQTYQIINKRAEENGKRRYSLNRLKQFVHATGPAFRVGSHFGILDFLLGYLNPKLRDNKSVFAAFFVPGLLLGSVVGYNNEYKHNRRLRYLQYGLECFSGFLFNVIFFQSLLEIPETLVNNQWLSANNSNFHPSTWSLVACGIISFLTSARNVSNMYRADLLIENNIELSRINLFMVRPNVSPNPIQSTQLLPESVVANEEKDSPEKRVQYPTPNISTIPEV